MIFRKPYAFLIKNFKLINFILGILTSYLFYRTYKIVAFFNDYVTNNYTGNIVPGFYQDYVPGSNYFVIFLILLGLFGVTLLFIYKKKPSKTYISSIVYYIVMIILFSVVKNLMITMEETIITAESARIYRDLSTLSLLPQIGFIIAFFIRGFGLNISKFNFKEDLKDLEVSSEDSEEIEITLKKDDVKLKRNIHRFGREFLYYIKENKFIFSIICVFVAGALIYFIYNLFPERIDNQYSQGDAFSYQGVNYKLEDSIVTNLNYRGEVLDIYYVVVRMNIENTNDEKYTLDLNKFRLEIDEEKLVYPSKDKSLYFIDYAKEQSGSIINAKTKDTYAIVYKIDEKDIRKNYRIKAESGSSVVNNVLVGKFTYVTITPARIDSVTKEGSYKLGDTINFANSNLGNSTFKVDKIVLNTKYTYDYEYCIKDKCDTYKDSVTIDYLKGHQVLLILDSEFKMAEDIPFYSANSNSLNRFLDNYLSIRYLDGEEEKVASVKNLTPSNLKGKIVLNTTDKVVNSSKIDLLITIRNKEYSISLK